MCSSSASLLIQPFFDNLAISLIPTTPLSPFDLCLKNWIKICITIWILLTRSSPMASSERGCCVPRCGKTRKDDTILHSFPNPDKDRVRYEAWIEAVGMDKSLDSYYIYKNRRVCHDHFEQKYLTWTRRLSPGAVPSLLLPGCGTARIPLGEITNQYDLPSNFGTSLPTLSQDEGSTQVIETSICQDLGGPSVMDHQQGTKIKNLNKKGLIKIINQQKIKHTKYATRLQKALKLSQNKTFLKTVKQFTTLAALFTFMQFREITKNKMGRRFKLSEKIMALSLYKRSPRAYRWLEKIFVLPSAMTLSRLISQVNLKPGLNQNIFDQLKKKCEKMKDDDKLCILLFDEMAITPHFVYNQRKDEISGFANDGIKKESKLADHALVFMIRGVIKKYKQPIAYTFSSGTTNSENLAILLKKIIKNLNNVGLCVLATVCDQGTSNVKAINFLIDETKRKYWKQNKELQEKVFDVDEKVVYPLFDPPHLIKGIRNNLMNKDLKCTINGNIKIARWDHIKKLYEEDTGYKGIKLVKKLSNYHINPDKFQKMKVKFATQALSQKVAVTMGFLAEKKILPADCLQTADVILFFDELFDSYNGSYENLRKRSGKNLLGPVTPKSEHRSVWQKAKIVLTSMKYINNHTKRKQATVPTINNWLRTINNTENLIKKLLEEYNFKSIWMRHFNQDPLENFFGSIRSYGYRNNNPTAASFESSFSALLINNLSGQYSPGSNCEDDSCHGLFTIKSLFKNSKSECEPTEFINLNFEYVEYTKKKENPKIYASLQYVTGYLLKKAKIKVFKNCKHCNNILYDKENKNDFLKLREFRKGKYYLTYPSDDLVNLFSNMQDLITYVLKHQSSINNIKMYIKTLIHSELDFNLFNCIKHKNEITNVIVELAIKFFICNWCRDLNKIINGSKAIDDKDDDVKVKALNYYNKKKHLKKNF